MHFYGCPAPDFVCTPQVFPLKWSPLNRNEMTVTSDWWSLISIESEENGSFVCLKLKRFLYIWEAGRVMMHQSTSFHNVTMSAVEFPDFFTLVIFKASSIFCTKMFSPKKILKSKFLLSVSNELKSYFVICVYQDFLHHRTMRSRIKSEEGATHLSGIVINIALKWIISSQLNWREIPWSEWLPTTGW